MQVEDLVVVMDEGLRGHAAGIAQRLRRAGRRVDLVLEPKKMKWVFKVSQSYLLEGRVPQIRSWSAKR